MTERILLVEDDANLGAQVVDHLRRAGFATTWLRDGDAALAEDPSRFALVILDLMLPGAYGLDVLKRVRARSEVPVLILSARDDAADKVRALSLGADDYVTKPFWPQELVARVNARLRRPTLERREGPIRVGDLVVDVGSRAVSTSAGTVDLTPAEHAILVALARRAGSAITRAALTEAALDPGAGASERTLDVHVSRLRKKLGAWGERIATVWGIGYKLVPPSSDE